MPTLTLTIQQLYDRVWSEPIHRISKEFGLSDRGLGKLCAHHKIPVPERGYDHDQIAERGFSEPPMTSYGNEKTKAGAELTDVLRESLRGNEHSRSS
jgi:hypothetical protein